MSALTKRVVSRRAKFPSWVPTVRENFTPVRKRGVEGVTAGASAG